jgi:ABC-type antimicrobial peptide transport system permease subunit
VSWPIIAFGLFIATLVGLISMGIPSYRASNITVLDGLRRVG